MSEKILNLNEQIIKKTIFKDTNRIKIVGEYGVLTIYLNQDIPEKPNFILHPVKYFEFKKKNSSIQNIQLEDCKLRLFKWFYYLSIKVLSPEDIWQSIYGDIVNSQNFQYSFVSGTLSSTSQSFTFTLSNIFVLKN